MFVLLFPTETAPPTPVLPPPSFSPPTRTTTPAAPAAPRASPPPPAARTGVCPRAASPVFARRDQPRAAHGRNGAAATPALRRAEVVAVWTAPGRRRGSPR